MDLKLPRTTLRDDYSISKVIKGGWQLAGGHGAIDEQQAIADMRDFVSAGITTFDCADIYTGVEELIGKFLRKYKGDFIGGELAPVQIHTKYVPDFDALATVSKVDTEKIIDRSLKRLGVERLDLVQFAWWDYSVPRYVDVCLQLADLQKAGKIRYIGATNFNASSLGEMLDAGCPIITNQVQYSVLDNRPAGRMQKLCQQHNISFLCYGSVAGGFLTEKYLGVTHGQFSENRSLVKYQLIMEETGGFDHFQDLLQVLKNIADEHDVRIAEVAARYVLQQNSVSAVIIGARNASHLQSLKKLASLTLDAAEIKKIQSIIQTGPAVPGDVYDIERDKDGPHGRIMKYNLNESATN
ncbi:MAG: aldo/keto reductase [Xanthomonadales bacterium]|nr:aldo/keto reductase [Xanthomonadales bacterium]